VTFGGRVQRRRRLVEDQDRRVLRNARAMLNRCVLEFDPSVESERRERAILNLARSRLPTTSENQASRALRTTRACIAWSARPAKRPAS